MKKLLILLLFTASAFGQATTGYHRVGQVLARGSSGTEAVVQPFSNIAVTSTATGLAATIYSDPLLTAPISPSVVTADEMGNYDYYLPLNYCVNESISYPSSGGITIANVCVNSSTTSGTVNHGTIGQLAYYATTGTAVSGENFATIAQGGTNASTVAGAWTNILAGSLGAANTVLAGPTSGGSAPLAVRGLVSADIPNNAANTTGNANTATLAATATALAATPTQCTGGQVSTGIAASGNANCTAPSTGLTQINGVGSDGTTPAGGGIQPLTLKTVNGSPGTCGDDTHTCQVTVDGKGRTTSQTPVAITFPAVATPIIAKVSFTSCTLGDDGTGGSGCQATQSWGSTLAGTYYYWCQPDYVAVSCGNLGDCSGIILDRVSQTATDFTYILNQRLNNGRGNSVSVTCWATN